MARRWMLVPAAALAVAVWQSSWPGIAARAGGIGQVDDPAAGAITTVAGGSAPGGAALDSTFFQPYSAVVDPGGTVYVADTYDNQIKAIDPKRATVFAVAGTGDAGFAGDGGPARLASFNFPMGLAIGPNGDIYVADTWNDRVRRIDPRTRIVTTVAGNGPNDATGRRCHDAGGAGPKAVISTPHSVAVDGLGDVLVADTGCDVIERVTAATGDIRVVAGIDGRSGTGPDGIATSSLLANPLTVAADPLGNAVVADTSNHIFYINLLARPVTLFPRAALPVVVPPHYKVAVAGQATHPVDGDGVPARLATAAAQMLSFGPDGSLLFTESTMRVRRIDWATGLVTTVAGNGTAGTGAEHAAPDRSPLSYPAGLFADGRGGFMVVDRGNSRLRDVVPGGSEATLAGRPNGRGPALGDGLPGPRAQLDWPRAVAAGPRGVYVADSYNLRIRRLNPDGSIVTVVGSGPPCVRLGVASNDCEAGATPPQEVDGTSLPLHINTGTGMASSPGGLLAFADAGRVYLLNDTGRAAALFPSSPQRVVVPAGYVRQIAGGGTRPVSPAGPEPAIDSSLQSPAGFAFTEHHELLVSEQLANRIDRIDLVTGEISVLAGSAYSGDLSGTAPVATAATWLDGPTSMARFRQPIGIAAGPEDTVYVADTGNNVIRRIDRKHGLVTTVAGDGRAGFGGDGGPAPPAELAYPTDVTVAPDRSLLVVDWGNERIRRIDPGGTIRTFAGSGPGRVGRRCGSTVPCGHYNGDGGAAPRAQLYLPLDGASFAALGPGPGLYLADTMNNRVRMVALTPARPGEV
jgi:sugar lactone lactonase YvrE